MCINRDAKYSAEFQALCTSAKHLDAYRETACHCVQVSKCSQPSIAAERIVPPVLVRWLIEMLLEFVRSCLK